MTTYICDYCGKKTENPNDFMLQKVVDVHLGACGDYCCDCFKHLTKVAVKFKAALDDAKTLFQLKCLSYKSRGQFFGRETVDACTRFVFNMQEIFSE